MAFWRKPANPSVAIIIETPKQKVKYFKTASNQKELEQINQFISDPKINATGIASSKFGIILLYEEK